MEMASPENQPDAEALQLLKDSGLLNQDVTLEKVMSLSEELNQTQGGAANLSFIFRDFIFRSCN
jgi:hypothetical protein